MRHWLTLCAALAAASPALASEAEGGGANPFAGDVGTAVWTVVIFAVVLWVLGRFAWGPVLDGLRSREEFITDSLERAKEDREAAEARLREYEERLTHARAEATAIVEEGKRDGDELRHKIEEKARAEADAMVARAKREIQIAQETAIKELYQRTGELATLIASRVVRKEIDATEHARLIAESIEELGTARPS